MRHRGGRSTGGGPPTGSRPHRAAPTVLPAPELAMENHPRRLGQRRTRLRQMAASAADSMRSARDPHRSGRDNGGHVSRRDTVGTRPLARGPGSRRHGRRPGLGRVIPLAPNGALTEVRWGHRPADRGWLRAILRCGTTRIADIVRASWPCGSPPQYEAAKPPAGTRTLQTSTTPREPAHRGRRQSHL